MMYYDDCEVCNPYSKVHKLGEPDLVSFIIIICSCIGLFYYTDVFIGKQSDFIDYHPYYTHQTFNAIKDYIVLK